MRADAQQHSFQQQTIALSNSEPMETTMLMRRDQSVAVNELAGLERRFSIVGLMFGLLMLVNIGSTVAMLVGG